MTDPMFIIAPLEVLTDSRLTDPERRVLLALFSFRRKNTNTVWPAVESIAARAHIKDKTRVSKITSSLAKKGWLTKKKRGFSGCNRYELIVPEGDANLDSKTTLDPESKLDAKSNNDAGTTNAENTGGTLDSPSKLDSESNIDGDALSNLDSETNSMLDSDANYKEQDNEQYSEQEKDLLCDSTPVDDLFDEFWQQYPRKTQRQDALRAFRKLKPDRELTDTLIRNVLQRVSQGEWEPDTPAKQYIPHAATWLNGRRWEDEIIPRQAGGSSQSREERNQRVQDRWLGSGPSNQSEDLI